MSIDLNGLKNGTFKHLESSLKSMHLFQRLMGAMNCRQRLQKTQTFSAVRSEMIMTNLSRTHDDSCQAQNQSLTKYSTFLTMLDGMYYSHCKNFVCQKPNNAHLWSFYVWVKEVSFQRPLYDKRFQSSDLFDFAIFHILLYSCK